MNRRDSVRPTLLRLGSFACLLGATSLLLADSAECHTSSFSQIYDVTTTCQGGRSGRIKVTFDQESLAAVKLLSGDIYVSSADLVEQCEGDSMKFEGVILHLSALSPFAPDGGDGSVTCTVYFDQLGQDVDCQAMASASTCTLRLTQVN